MAPEQQTGFFLGITIRSLPGRQLCFLALLGINQ